MLTDHARRDWLPSEGGGKDTQPGFGGGIGDGRSGRKGVRESTMFMLKFIFPAKQDETSN